jgi:pilus assembly protein CpaE
MYPLTIAAAIENAELWAEVQAALDELPVRVCVEQRDLADFAAFLYQLERARAEVVLLDVGRVREPVDDVLRKLRAASPDSMIVALHTSADADTILAAFRAGVNEYICPPLEANLRRALEWKSNDQRRREGVRNTARTVAFFSAKGGCGATTLACHVAMDLGRRGRKVLLADLDLEAGMVAFLTRSKSPYSVVDALNNIHRLDLSYWKALVSNGIPNVEIISAPVAVASREIPRQEQVRHVLSFVRLHYDWTVVDMGRSLNVLSMNALEEMDEACLVTTVEIPALHQAKQIVGVLLDSGFPRTRLRLVLNRVPKNLEITTGELETMIGVPVYAMVPNNYPELYECYSEGKLLSRGSKLGRQIGEISRKLAGIGEEEEEPRARRRFALFK